jgi:hypothetical protein
MNRAPAAATSLVALLALTACTGGDDPEPTETTTPAASACEPVPQELVDSINRGAEDGSGMVVDRAAAYRSPNHEKVYFVAGHFTAPGVDDATGVWVTNSIDPAAPGILMAADAFAQQFTVWPDADKTDAAIGLADPGIPAAKDCLTQMS